MAVKKDRTKYTIKFNETSLTHIKAMRILESLPARGNAQFIADALVFYNEAFGFYDVSPDALRENISTQNTRPININRDTMVEASERKSQPVIVNEELKKEEFTPEKHLVYKNYKENTSEPAKEKVIEEEQYISHSLPANEAKKSHFTPHVTYDDDEDDENDEAIDNVFAESLLNGFNL